jgi:phage terminase large subunit-like protein
MLESACSETVSSLFNGHSNTCEVRQRYTLKNGKLTADFTADDPFEDESCWIKANPNLGVSITRKYLVERVHEAKGMPAKKSETSRFNFCQWVDAGNPAIPGELWRACVVPDAEWDEEAMRGRRCIGGLDLSGTRDLTAKARVYEPDDDGIVHAVVEFWTPGDTMRERAARDHVPYDLWVEQGYVIATPGRAVDYRWVAQRISEVQVETEMAELAYDPYRIKYLEPDLSEAGVEITLLPHGQGFGQSAESGLWMPRSVELLEELIGKGLLRVKHNPALDYAAASAVHKPDPKGNYIYDKMASTGRIDGIVALAMAVGALFGAETGDTGSIFDDDAFWTDTPDTEKTDESPSDDTEEPW